MRSNKGYTLVELMVAVAVLLVVMAELGSLMVNSQTLYRNGFYEVSLQENAQQVIQQVQDMLVNATDKVEKLSNTDDAGITSDIILITTKVRNYNASGFPDGTYKTLTYKIGRDVDLITGTTLQGEAGKEYGDLVMIINDGTDDSDPIPVAHGVRRLTMDTVSTAQTDADGNILTDTDGNPLSDEYLKNYLEADVVTLALEMQNEKYSYTAYSGETYLRNKPGTGGYQIKPVPPDNGASLTVLRYQTYDLKKSVPDGYTEFKWGDDCDSSTTTKYQLNGNTLKCTGLNDNWDQTADATVLASNKPAGDPNQWDDAIPISIHTDAVNNGTKILLTSWNKSDECANYIPVYGLSTIPANHTSHTLEAQIFIDEVQSYPDINVIQWYPYQADVTYKPCDLVTLKSGDNFTIKHQDGSAYTEYDEFAHLDNVTFATGTNDILVSPKILLNFYKHNAGADTAHSTNSELNANYTELGNNVQFMVPTNTKYTFGYTQAGASNAFILSTHNECVDQGATSYWDYLVDPNVGNGYIRVKLTVTYPNAKVYTAYAYYYPQLKGTQAQHNAILNYVTNP